jgi:hypothetical protein
VSCSDQHSNTFWTLCRGEGPWKVLWSHVGLSSSQALSTDVVLTNTPWDGAPKHPASPWTWTQYQSALLFSLLGLPGSAVQVATGPKPSKSWPSEDKMGVDVVREAWRKNMGGTSLARMVLGVQTPFSPLSGLSAQQE